jgi:hypothetical protein
MHADHALNRASFTCNVIWDSTRSRLRGAVHS